MVRILEPSVEILTPLDGEAILKHLELCCRNCYLSEGNITEGSAEKMLKKIIELDHTAMLEHFAVTVKIMADTGVLKDITRHRVCSFAVESTRYNCYAKDKFGKEITVMNPDILFNPDDEGYQVWLKCMEDIEKAYMKLSEMGYKPDVCRMLLPHSTKASIIMTANIREWRHIFKLRCAPQAHPTVQQIMKMVLKSLHDQIPVVFDDVYEKFITNQTGES